MNDEIEFVDLVPAPRFLANNKPFDLGVRITVNGELVLGTHPEMQLYVLFRGAEYAKLSGRYTLKLWRESPLVNHIFKGLNMNELPPHLVQFPGIEIRFKVCLLTSGLPEIAVSRPYRIIQGSENARVDFGLPESDLEREMATGHDYLLGSKISDSAQEESDEDEDDDEDEYEDDYDIHNLDVSRELMDWALSK